MGNISKFQLIVMAVFGVAILAGTLVFSLNKGGSGDVVSDISVWGYVTNNEFARLSKVSGLADNDSLDISYTQKSPESFDVDFVNALADGVAPDVVYIGQDSILAQSNRLIEIPYASYSQRDFQNNFADASEVFLTPTGIRMLPLSIDPIVLYWNKRLFTDANMTEPPKTWASYTSQLVSTFTKKDGQITINQSALPFGTWDNLNAAKGILSSLIFQGGGNITDQTANGSVVSTLRSGGTTGVVPAEAALNFFVDFSNPQKNVYTWNRSLPNSLDYFASGQSATYLGYASEVNTINAKNPNLSFDMAVIPQGANNTKVTYAKMTGLALTKASKNIPASVQVMYALSAEPAMAEYNAITSTAPTSRAMLGDPDRSNALTPVVYSSAIIARTWLEPNGQKTSSLFGDMVNSVVSGRKRVSEAVAKIGRAHV